MHMEGPHLCQCLPDVPKGLLHIPKSPWIPQGYGKGSNAVAERPRECPMCPLMSLCPQDIPWWRHRGHPRVSPRPLYPPTAGPVGTGLRVELWEMSPRVPVSLFPRTGTRR